MVVGDVYGSNASIYYVDLENGTLEKVATKIEEIKDEDDNVTYLAVANVTDTGFYAVASNDIIGGGAADDDIDFNGGSGGFGDLNGDSSTTSPPTGDNVILLSSIIVILAGATVLFVRKAKI